jgi:hypothetical protein
MLSSSRRILDIGLRFPSFEHKVPFRFNLLASSTVFLYISPFQPGLDGSVWKVASRFEQPLKPIVTLINRSFNRIGLSYKQKFMPNTTVLEIPTYEIWLWLRGEGTLESLCTGMCQWLVSSLEGK